MAHADDDDAVVADGLHVDVEAVGVETGAELTEKDRLIHEQGLVSVLRQIHDDLEEAFLTLTQAHTREEVAA